MAPTTHNSVSPALSSAGPNTGIARVTTRAYATTTSMTTSAVFMAVPLW